MSVKGQVLEMTVDKIRLRVLREFTAWWEVGALSKNPDN